MPELVRHAEAHVILVGKLIKAAAIPHWIELAESLPMLAVMLAECEEFDGKPEENSADRIRDYLRLKRRELCGKLGFPNTNATVKVISRMDLAAFHTQRIFWLYVLREILNSQPDAAELLARERRIGVDVISQFVFGCTAREFRTLYRFDITSLPKLCWFFRLLPSKREWLVKKWLAVHRPMPGLNPAIEALFAKPTPRFSHFRNEKLTWQYCKERLELRERLMALPPDLKKKLSPLRWPAPPLPPSENIRAIQNLGDLKAEAETMNHCAVQFADSILAGYYYVYQMLTPVRATIGIRFDGAQWICDEIRGKSNSIVTNPLTQKEMTDWLQSHGRNSRESRRLSTLREIARNLGEALKYPRKGRER